MTNQNFEDAIRKIKARIELNEECLENFGLTQLPKELVEKENEFLKEILNLLL